MVFTTLSTLIFLIIYLFLTFRAQIRIILSRPRLAILQLGELKDPILLQLIKEKSGVSLDKIVVISGNMPYGLMHGIINRPVMNISKNMVDTFSRAELSYVVLHEIAHYKYKHALKELLVGIVLLILSLVILLLIGENPWQLAISPILAFLSGVVNVQYGRVSEIQADEFAASNLSSKEGMITATQKLQVAWSPNYKVESITHLLFDRGNPYEMG
jgi:Zn-dependent protease with chaperone function